MFGTTLIILFILVIGLTLTVFLLIRALIKNKKERWKQARISGLTTVVVVIILFTVQELVLYPTNPKLDKLVFVAHREAPIGAYWLGLYDDSTWDFGVSSREVEFSGTYQLNGDTIELTTFDELTFYKGETEKKFIIDQEDIWEVENSGIRGLEIKLNKLKNEL